MVNFDTWDNASSDEEINKILAVVGGLTCGFVEEDDAVDVFFEIWGGKEDITIITAIFVGIRDV